MKGRVVYIILYISAVILLTMITPLYGDPGVVHWTGKVMAETGFAYDPVCSKNIKQLCVRAPLYYAVLALLGEAYWIANMIFFVLFIYFQVMLIRSLSDSAWHLFGFLAPPIYLLFSRTYVDSLTSLLSTILLYVLVKNQIKGKRLYKFALVALPALLMLARETSLTLPAMFVLTALFVKNIGRKTILLLFSGWLAGMIAYAAYIILSGGSSYSDFQPHIPTAEEAYRALLWSATSILPWEVTTADIKSYMTLVFPTPLSDWSTLILLFSLNVLIHSITTAFLVSGVLGLMHLRQLNGAVKSQLVYGLLVAVALLFLKGDLDFYRHLSYLLPTVPIVLSFGLQEIIVRNRRLKIFFMTLAVLAFSLYLLRTFRSYMVGSEFDACAYLLKRPEISNIQYFYETACETR